MSNNQKQKGLEWWGKNLLLQGAIQILGIMFDLAIDIATRIVI